MIYKQIQRGFTLLELIFVIVVLGIVSSIGASLIADVYERYILQQALHSATTKSDLAAKQITARLMSRVNYTTIGRKDDGTYKTIDTLDPGDQYRILEWIGYDNDSFSATAVPGWSGFCDVDSPSTTYTSLMTPGSQLSMTSTIIGNLGGAVTDAAVIFNSLEYSTSQNYSVNTMGYDGNPATTISPVGSFTGDTILNVTDNNPKALRDQYKLVWSAYAIVPVVHTDNPDTTVDESQVFDLNLHYNYQPWLGNDYTTGTVRTLVKDVTTFKFKGVANTVRFKICVQEKISESETVNICKEKVVIR